MQLLQKSVIGCGKTAGGTRLLNYLYVVVKWTMTSQQVSSVYAVALPICTGQHFLLLEYKNHE